MNIKLRDGEFFKNIIYSIKDLSETIDFYFDKKCLKIETVDISQICVLHVNIHNHMFDHFDVNNKFTICLNINNLYDILKTSKKDSSLELKYTPDTDRINIIQNSSKRGVNFNIQLLRSDAQRIAFTGTEFTYMISIDGIEFEKIIKDVLGISKNCSLQIKDNTLEIEVSGDIGEGVFVMNDCENITKKTMPENIKINTEFLYLVSKCSKISKLITLKIDYDKPLCCEFLFTNPDTGEDGGYLTYYLAHVI